MSKGPAIVVEYREGGIRLECHSGQGMICRNIPDWLNPWMEAYAAGKPVGLERMPSLAGLSPFTQSVLMELLNIPWGKFCTYKDLAASVNRPKAFRAVGSACGRNPFPLLIPCHRVVGSQGLGGFSAGLEVKKRLLEHELGTPFAPS